MITEHTEFEPTPERVVADYESYRKVVDAFSPAYRKVGIVDATGYDQAMRDPSTVRLRIGGVELPLLARLDYVSGYDVERSQRLTETENVYVMAMPLPVLAAPETKVLSGGSEFQPQASAIIVETDHTETPDIQQALPDALRSIGEYEAQEFLDERIRNPEQQPAMMAMYEGRFTAVEDSGEPIPRKDIDFFEAYERLVAADHPLTKHTQLLHVDELRDDEQLVEDLWELCQDRFDWLGDAHPVSMEDTKDFFVQMVLNDKTHTIVRYNDDGKPVCLGFFMSGFDECDWIKPEYRDAALDQAEARGEEVLYFYGIASKSKEAAHYGRDVMQLLSHMVQRRGGSYRLMFESTNMSSRYIPRMVSQYAGEGEGVQLEPIQKVDQIDYWYLSPVKTD